MFRSVKNWLTLLIAAVVAFAMLVAWVYVVPPLRGRLVEQKLADARGNARIISDTLAPWLGVDPDTGQPTVEDRGALLSTLNSLSARFGGRTLVFTRNQVLMVDSSGQASPDVADYPMLDQAIRKGRDRTRDGDHGERAVSPPPPYRCSRRTPGRVVAAVLVISSLAGRRQRRGGGAAPAAVRHGPGAGHQPAAGLHGLVLHRPPAQAHRAERGGHRRRRPLGQGARDGGGRDRAAGRHLQRHGRQAAQRLRPGRVRARPRRGAAQRPE